MARNRTDKQHLAAIKRIVNEWLGHDRLDSYEFMEAVMETFDNSSEQNETQIRR